MPLAIAVAGANVHDTNLVTLTLEAIMVQQPDDEGPPHLCLDAGYAGERTAEAVAARGYVPYVRPRHEDKAHARSADPTKKPRRWVVERLHAWLNRSRRLLARWEKLQRTYEAFLHLACALICFQQCHRAMATQVSE